ncbi:hypothetical protein [Nocardia sp. R7R-8]|uniref:hypothetical protein n=1 Tax=Nocardia sp. R7R-8 TaxID=3459304 RepID=UPI00403E0891
MRINNTVVRVVLGVAAVVATMATAGTAAAEESPQPTPVRCSWGGDGLFAQRECDNNGNTGSASGSGHALGQFLGRILFPH